MAKEVWRRGTESNRRMGLLQSPALPLGYPADNYREARLDKNRRCIQWRGSSAGGGETKCKVIPEFLKRSMMTLIKGWIGF